jgi:copper transport protein
MVIFLFELALIFYVSYQPLYSTTAFAQISLESSPPALTPQTETVTSYYDALLKVPLIVSQTAIVGVVLNHIILRRVIQNKMASNSSKTVSPVLSQDSKNMYLYPLKRFFLMLLSCGIAMIVSASSLFLLQAFNLSSELAIDVPTTFTILYSTPIGPVWNLRVITSSIIIVSSILYYLVEKKRLMNEDANSVSNNNSPPQREMRNVGVLQIILLFIIIISGSISIFSNSMVSHNTALSFYPSLAIFMDWLHFMAVSIWLGGLFYISTILLMTIRITITKNRDTGGSINKSLKANKLHTASHFLALLLPYFSLIATMSLGIIGITGLYMAWIHLHTAEAIFTSSYGNILVIKLLLVLPMVVLGAYHQIKLHSSLMKVTGLNKEGQERFKEQINTKTNGMKSSNNHKGSKILQYDPSLKFSKTIKIESLIGIGVLVAASFLTITSPPSISIQESLSGNEGSLEGEAQRDYMPSFDSFTILAIILAAAVLSGSMIYFKKSKQQVRNTCWR